MKQIIILILLETAVLFVGTSEITANITCDDKMVLYADGVELDIKNEEWRESKLYTFSATTKVVAIHGINVGGPAGIIGSFSTGLVTDESWRCSNKLVSEWESPDFDDSKWLRAVVFQHCPISNSPKILRKAKWIWTSTSDDFNVYCRKLLVPNKPTKITVTNIRERSAKISWVNPKNTGDGDLTRVWIQVKKNNSLILNTTLSKVHTYKLVGLTRKTTYKISVSAGNKHRLGEEITASFTTLENGGLRVLTNISSGDLKAKRGDRVNLLCSAQGEPPITFSWEKDKKPLDSFVEIEDPHRSSFVVVSVKNQASFGKYICHIRDQFQSTTHTMSVQQFTEDGENLIYLAGIIPLAILCVILFAIIAYFTYQNLRRTKSSKADENKRKDSNNLNTIENPDTIQDDANYEQVDDEQSTYTALKKTGQDKNDDHLYGHLINLRKQGLCESE